MNPKLTERLNDIEVFYDHNVISINGHKIRLQPKEMDLFFSIHGKKGVPLNFGILLHNMYGHYDEPSNPVKSMHVIVHNVNKKLRPHGFCLAAVRERGYKIDLFEKKAEVNAKWKQ